MDKQEIRKQVTDQKNALTKEQVEQWSLQLKEKFCGLDVYREAECIYFYMTFNNEVQTMPMIEQALADGKRVAAPLTLASGNTFYPDGRPKRDYMEFIYLQSMDDCIEGYMGIPEPDEALMEDPARIADEKKVLILMPGLAFDRNRCRIGYGGGFYDKYLSQHPDTEFIKVALCFDFQVFDEIPTEPHDEKMDLVISPSYTIS